MAYHDYIMYSCASGKTAYVKNFKGEQFRRLGNWEENFYSNLQIDLFIHDTVKVLEENFRNGQDLQNFSTEKMFMHMVHP